MKRPPPTSTLFPYTTLFRSKRYSPTGIAGQAQKPRGRHHALPVSLKFVAPGCVHKARSEEHTSELQSPDHLVCRLLLEKKKHLYQKKNTNNLKIMNIRQNHL